MTEPPSPLGLGLMCKPPRAGATKTRLAATIGANLAARLSRAFLQDCAYAALEAADLCQLKPMAFYRPADGGAELGEVLGPDWPLVHADAGDLGATMLDEAMLQGWQIQSFQEGTVFFIEFNHRDERLTRNLNLRKAFYLAQDSGELVNRVIKLPGYLTKI